MFDISKSLILRLLLDRRGQDLVEYALISGFVATCAVAAFPAITATGTRFSTVLSLLQRAVAETAAR